MASVGSASGVTVNNRGQQEIKDQMNANSQAWHNAKTQAEKDALHKANQELAGMLGGNVSYNNGYWSGSAGSSGSSRPSSGSSSGSSRPTSGSSSSSSGISRSNGGTSGGVVATTPDQQAIVDQMRANSEAWHNAKTQAEKDALHKKNQELAGLLGGNVSYDNGVWSGTASGGGVPIGTSRPNDFQGSASGITANDDNQQAIIDQMNKNSAAWWDAKTQAERDALHKQNQYLAGLLGGDVRYDNGVWSGTAAPSQQAEKADIGQFTDLLDKWLEAAQQQAQQANDYAVSQGVNELTRAEEDAKAQFQTQRDQIASAEALAKDNQALYAEARGDRGGIGGAQYDSVMNTAMQQQAAVNQAQTKLSTDTARQIADLRAQGEFQKADDLLELSQNYLSQLISLQQWAMQYNLSVDQFNASLQQWQKEFELSVGQLMGSYGGSPTLAAQQFEYEKQWNQQQLELSQKQDLQSQLASAGSTLLGAGIMPSDSQLAAMGMDRTQAEAYIKALTIMNSSSGGSGGSSGGSSGGGGSSSGGSSGGSVSGDIYQQMWDAGARTYDSAYAYLLGLDYTSTEAEKLAGFMEEKVENGDFFLHQNKVQEAYNLLAGMKLTDAQRKDPEFMALQIGNLAKQASYGLSAADVKALFRMFGYDPSKYM